MLSLSIELFNMKSLLKLEELAQFGLAVLLFAQLDYSWWLFPACILLPDVSMIGYAVNPRIGAVIYNFFHHKLLGIAVLAAGYWLGMDILMFIGIILFGHSAMDRIFGYGLKYPDNFKNTHLGRIGKK